MRRLPFVTVAALGVGQAHLAHLWLLLRARPRRLALAAMSLAVLVAGVFMTMRLMLHETAAPVDDSAPPRYLAVCGACGWRGTFAQHPAQALDRRGVALRCTQCGAYRVTWYRRGGQAAPPGGWSTDVTNPTAASQNLVEAGP